jgi:hypothetical protein
MPPYWLAGNAWLASEKYVKVTSPVAPMPSERTAAPRP